MKVLGCSIPGCYVIELDPFLDARGDFVKLFSDSLIPLFQDFRIREVFFSHSKEGVVRGMQAQTPPFDHNKLVLCLAGEAFDVLVDLRVGSPSYGKSFDIRLHSRQYKALFIPKGVAHGFCALQPDTTVAYFVDSLHSSAHDLGVHWRSVDVEWPVENPTVSSRDEALPPIGRFESPFTFLDGPKS